MIDAIQQLKMSKPKRSISLVVLGAVCAIGLLLAGHRYLLLGAINDALKTQEALDASFSVALKAGATVPSSPSQTASSAVIDHLAQTAAVRQAVTQIAASIELGQMAEAALWLVALAIAFIWLRRSDHGVGGSESSSTSSK